MSWQYKDPRLAPRAHHVEDLRKKAAEYRLTRDLILNRRRQRLANLRAWVTQVLVTAFGRRRWEPPAAPVLGHGRAPVESVTVLAEGPSR